MRKALQPLNNENGMVLVVAIMIMSALILLGATAVMESTTDLRIAGNYKTNAIALYAAEAGIEEARARLAGNFTPSGSKIVDSDPTSAGWSTSLASLQSAMVYTATIRHMTDTSGNVLYWSDSNISTTVPSDGHGPIYLITSSSTSSNASKTLEAMVTKLPPITVPGPLYVNAPTAIIGNANINGIDQCGTAATDKPGVVSSLASGSVSQGNNATIAGTTPNITYNSPVLNVSAMIIAQKQAANYTYNVVSATHTGMDWTDGGLTDGASLTAPSSCTVQNIVYYNTRNSDNLTTDIKLAGGTKGCGMLLVDGDLDINGGFAWYGIVLVSGSVKYTGGGDRNITGGVVAGGSVIADIIGGNTNIVYCSSAVNSQTANKPLIYLSWKE